MSSFVPRPVSLALVLGLITLSVSAAEARSFGVNLGTRAATQGLPQTVHVGGHRPHSGSVVAPPSPALDRRHRPHLYDPNTQFGGMGTSSANTKPIK